MSKPCRLRKIRSTNANATFADVLQQAEPARMSRLAWFLKKTEVIEAIP